VSQKSTAYFIEDGDASEAADGEPERFAAVAGEADDKIRDGRPQQRIEGVHGEEV